MKVGRLGVQTLAPNTNTAIYTVPDAQTVSGSVLMCNFGTDSSKIRLAIVDGGVAALANEDYIEYGATIPVGGILERTGLLLSAGESVVAWCEKGSVSVRMHGYEEA